jgi:Na+/melibiose symporter-like transporter
MRRLWALLRHRRDLRLVLGAGLVSLTGDWMLGIGLAYYVYVLTGATIASALVLLAAFLPGVLLGSLAGVFVDRWDRKHTMVTANVLLAVGLAPLLLVNGADRVWIVYVVLAWEGTVELFFAPAEQSMLPRLVDDAELVTANALNGQNRDLSRLGGSALGGIVVSAGGVTFLALIDAATFIVSALLIAAVRTSGSPERESSRPTTTRTLGRLTQLRSEWLDGLRHAGSSRVLRMVIVFLLLTSTGEGIMGTLFAPFVRDVLHGSGEAYGLIVAIQAVGGIIGGLVAAAIGERISAVLMFGGAALIFGLIDLVLFLYPLAYVAIWPALLCMLAVGLPGALTMAGFTTLVQRYTSDAYRGRVFASLGVVQSVAAIVGTLGAGLLGSSVGIVPIIALQGAGYVVAGAAVLLVLRSQVRQASPVVPAPG